MAFIEWTDKYEVGVKRVDEQHQRLFDLLNDLHAATVNGDEQTTLASVLDALVEYTVYHFETEEKLYVDYKCPDYQTHKTEHDKLTMQATRLQEDFATGSATISFDVLDFLHDWLVDHTTGLDKQMAPHLNSCGVY